MKTLIPFVLALVLAGCATIPRDGELGVKHRFSFFRIVEGLVEAVVTYEPLTVHSQGPTKIGYTTDSKGRVQECTRRTCP